MSDWEEHLLGDLLQFQRGFDITAKEQEAGNVPVVSSSGVTSFHNKAKVKGPGVITGRKGSLGKVHFIESDYWPHDTTLWIKDFKGNSPKFLYYLLQQMHLENYDVGASNPTLNRNHLHKIRLHCPSPKIQQKIAAVISAYDDLIENNNRCIALLEKAAEEIYREWFVRLRFPGWEQAKFVKGVPKEWEYKKISTVCDKITSGGTPRTDEQSYWGGGIPWLSSGETRKHFICETENTITQLGVESSSTRLAKSGTIVIAGAGQGNTRGQTSLLLLDTYINQSVLNLSAKLVSNYFLFFNLLNRYDELRLTSDAFSSRGSLTTKLIGTLDVVVPSKNICSGFDTIVESMIKQIGNIYITTSKLKISRDLLLPRLISGKLSVENLDIRFPPGMNST
ncbi:MAG: restriction endonuclease subunit S [Chloroflexota bacterium]